MASAQRTKHTSPASTVGVRELRQNLSKYLSRVKEGETLTVTERGHEVARLVPSHPDVDPYYLELAQKYGATIPKGNLVETIDRLQAEGRLGSGASPSTVDAILAEGRDWRI
jgi:prevent-host-death family protein